MKEQRALLVLASYDFESLQLTLHSLSHTIDNDEMVIVILNGKRNLSGELVERVAKAWAMENPSSRYVVRPLSSGGEAYTAITEVINDSPLLANKKYICKIDDDLIPLKKDWLAELAATYTEKAKSGSKMGFVTGLINNNSWGFKQLVTLFDKEKEYKQLFAYPTKAGDKEERTVPAGVIDDGMCGSVWQYPYMAWWLHQWTTLDINSFLSKTNNEGIRQVNAETHYSIGCIYFEKEFWQSLAIKKAKTNFDELLIHLKCKENNLEKWAVMNQPMIHLFYYIQRIPNYELLDLVAPELSKYFDNPVFNTIRRVKPEERQLMIQEKTNTIEDKMKRMKKKFF